MIEKNKKNKLFIVGIDPGKNGGIVSLTNGKITDITKMPPTPEELVDHFLYLGFPNQPIGVKSYVIMELVHAMPTDSSKAAFSFGKQVGQIEGVLSSFNIKPIYVSPQKWQVFYGLSREKNEPKYNYKKRIREFAVSRCPATGSFKELLTMATSDAYLISWWAYRNRLKLAL